MKESQINTLIFVEMHNSTVITLILLGVIVASLVLDLGLLSKNSNDQGLSLKQSLKRSGFWFGLGLFVMLGIYYWIPDLHEIADMTGLQKYVNVHGNTFKITNNYEESLHNFRVASAMAYLSGYLLEYALSVDNLFVMLLVFQSFKVSHKNEQRILIWGVLGAMILRFIFIYIGSAAIQRFHWILFVFGGLLVYSGIKLLLENEDKEFDPENHGVMKWVKKLIPVTELPDDKSHFFIRINGQLHATVLFVVLLIVEFTDVVFAIDSVPAVFGVTTDIYVVFFSNIFAILGLRSLYFLIGFGMDKFYALKYGLSIILVYIGIKMIFEDFFHSIGFTHFHNLLILVGILAISIFYSLYRPLEHPKE